MPKHEETFALNGTDTNTALAISYQAMVNLSWPVKFAGEDKLLGNTPKSWKSTGQQIMVAVENDNLTIGSEMVNGEALDISGKNKKNTDAFIKAYDAAARKATTKNVAENTEAINVLRQFTTQTAIEEEQKAAEVEAAMHLSSGNMWVTYIIMAINVVVFVLMVMDGADLFQKETVNVTYITWGSNWTPLTLSGDWWRLITSTFIHFGIIHLVMNMYCLYMAGVYLEPMLGKVKYTVAYLCTGVLASVASLWWHDETIIGAGASGAIFGLYGLFLALLTTNLIPKHVRQPLLQSIGIFVVFNIIYGVKGGVDNAAHIGGLISGFVFGYIYVFAIQKEKQGQKLLWIGTLLITITAGITFAYLQQNEVSSIDRANALRQTASFGHKDVEKYNTKLNEIGEIEATAMAPVKDTSLTDAELKNKIKDICFPLWLQAEEKLKQMQTLDVSPSMQTKTVKLLHYVDLRRKELDVFNRMIDTQQQDSLMPALQQVRDSINALAAEVQQLQ